VDGVLYVERPVVESLAQGLDAVRAGHQSPVLLELNARVRNANHATLQLTVLMQVEHLVFQRLQERRRIYAVIIRYDAIYDSRIVFFLGFKLPTFLLIICHCCYKCVFLTEQKSITVSTSVLCVLLVFCY